MDEEPDPQAVARELMGQPEEVLEPEVPPTPEPVATPEAPEANETQEEVSSTTTLETTAQVVEDELMQMLQSATPEERAQIVAQAREQALAARVGEQLNPYREELQGRIDAGELSVDVANEMMETKAESIMARLEREDALAQSQATAAKAAQDAFFSQVTSEFPGADVETLRQMAQLGVDPNALRTVAARQSEAIKKATETAVAKYVAAKGKDLETFVPSTGDASRPTGEDVLDENSSFGELLGIYKGKR